MIAIPQFTVKVQDLLKNAESYHERYYKVLTFGGPSVYFHQRSLASWNPVNLDPCLEYIYATLASWGMHRMGPGGSKMKPFAEFTASIFPLRDAIAEGRTFDCRTMTLERWAVIERVFKSIKVMASGTSLVGNSKVMAHLMPNIVPPIDREYTLKFLKGNGNIRNDLGSEWQLMRSIIEQLFTPTAMDPGFVRRADVWLSRRDEFPWDTSVFKIIDNLIIGTMQ